VTNQVNRFAATGKQKNATTVNRPEKGESFESLGSAENLTRVNHKGRCF
jgi:hypothetical protein